MSSGHQSWNPSRDSTHTWMLASGRNTSWYSFDRTDPLSLTSRSLPFLRSELPVVALLEKYAEAGAPPPQTRPLNLSQEQMAALAKRLRPTKPSEVRGKKPKGLKGLAGLKLTNGSVLCCGGPHEDLVDHASLWWVTPRGPPARILSFGWDGQDWSYESELSGDFSRVFVRTLREALLRSGRNLKLKYAVEGDDEPLTRSLPLTEWLELDLLDSQDEILDWRVQLDPFALGDSGGGDCELEGVLEQQLTAPVTPTRKRPVPRRRRPAPRR